MAIERMISKEEFEKDPTDVRVVSDYRGHATNEVFHHSYGDSPCPHSKDYTYESETTLYSDCSPLCRFKDPLYMRTTHKGLVLELREWNGRDDSDFYARVWNPEKQCVERVDYATTRGWTYPNNAQVDATPEVLEAVKLYEEAAQKKRQEAYEAELAKMPSKGARTVVVAGRKVPHGTEGVIFWIGKDTYGSRNRYANPYSYLLPFKYEPSEYRVGIRTANGDTVFTSAKNISILKGE